MKTSAGRRPPTQARMGTQAGRGRGIMPPSSMGRPGTGAQDGAARPMTAVKPAGFRGSGQFNITPVFYISYLLLLGI